MDTRHDASRAVSAALATAIEESLARTEPDLLTGVRLKAASQFLAEAMRERPSGEAVVRIDSSGGEADEAVPETARRMRLALINADMPFLVDSISACLGQAGIAIHLIVHPVLPVRRDAGGHLLGIGE